MWIRESETADREGMRLGNDRNKKAAPKKAEAAFLTKGKPNPNEFTLAECLPVCDVAI